MAVYNNFLNTPYDLKKSIVLGTLANYVETSPPDKAFIVYCEPTTIQYSKILSFFENASFHTNSTFSNNLSFRNKYIFGKKVDLFAIFNSLKNHNDRGVSSLTQSADAIAIQKYFYPYYESLTYKTTYWNIINVSDFITQMNIYYGDSRLTYENILKLTLEDDEELNLIINYDLYCPYFEYPIRFVFQYVFKLPKKKEDIRYECPLERMEKNSAF